MKTSILFLTMFMVTVYTYIRNNFIRTIFHLKNRGSFITQGNIYHLSLIFILYFGSSHLTVFLAILFVVSLSWMCVFSLGLVRHCDPNCFSSSLRDNNNMDTILMYTFLFYNYYFVHMTFIGCWEHRWNITV